MAYTAKDIQDVYEEEKSRTDGHDVRDRVGDAIDGVEVAAGLKGDEFLDAFERWLNEWPTICGPEDHFVAMRILNAIPYSLLKYDEWMERLVSNSLDRARSLAGSPSEIHKTAADEAIDRAHKFNDTRSLLNGLIKRAVDLHNHWAAEYTMQNPDNYIHKQFGERNRDDVAVLQQQAAIDALAKEMGVDLKGREEPGVKNAMEQTFERYEAKKEVH